MSTAEPLRIFIGTDESQTVAQKVLEYSIRKHASIPVEVVPITDLRDGPTPRNPADRPRTGFSLSRFRIPELCGYEGRAVYFDADTLVFGDVAELARAPFGDHSVLCTWQPDPPAQWKDDQKFRPGPHTAVLVLDCSSLDWDVQQIVDEIDTGTTSYINLARELSIVDRDDLGTIPVEWNHLERYIPGTTKLLHYTVVFTQPWKRDGNPLGALWESWYREALATGAVAVDDVVLGILDRHLKAGLATALAESPQGSEAVARALLALDETRNQLDTAEARIGALERSASWRIGNRVARLLPTRRRK